MPRAPAIALGASGSAAFLGWHAVINWRVRISLRKVPDRSTPDVRRAALLASGCRPSMWVRIDGTRGRSWSVAAATIRTRCLHPTDCSWNSSGARRYRSTGRSHRHWWNPPSSTASRHCWTALLEKAASLRSAMHSFSWQCTVWRAPPQHATQPPPSTSSSMPPTPSASKSACSRASPLVRSGIQLPSCGQRSTSMCSPTLPTSAVWANSSST